MPGASFIFLPHALCPATPRSGGKTPMAAALNIGPRTIRTPRLEGSGGAFMLTRGEPRYQQMNGRHYVVGRGAAYEHPTAVDACKHRDELLNAERAARRGRKDAARAAYLDAPPVQDR